MPLSGLVELSGGISLLLCCGWCLSASALVVGGSFSVCRGTQTAWGKVGKVSRDFVMCRLFRLNDPPSCVLII